MNVPLAQCPCVFVSLCPSVLVFSGPETLLSTGESILVSDLILYIVIARTRSTFHVPWPTTPVFALRFTLSLCPSVFSLQTSSKHLPPTNFETEHTPWDTWELAAAQAVRAIFRTYL